MGSSVYTLLPGESMQSLLKLGNHEDGPIAWRRILVYTDSVSSTIPIETMWSDEHFEGQPIEFVAANPAIPVSIVRHLGLEATIPMAIQSGKPLKMLVVFSNPRDEDRSLGEIGLENGHLDFTECLSEEKQALNDQLSSLVRLNLLDIHFLVGDGCENSPVVYRGRVQPKGSQVLWLAKPVRSGDLRGLLLTLLRSEVWHILHYFGHGTGGRDPELVLRPGHSLSCTEMGHQITQMPRLVTINACESSTPANLNAPVLTGFATLFLMRGTVNLVCMQMKVTPETATLTTRALYNKLSRSLFSRQMDFEEAFYEVRQQAHNSQNPRLDFFCPVLYSRPVNGRIFEYDDDRLGMWEAIVAGRLPWHPVKFWSPVKLWKTRAWCSKLKEQTRTIGLNG